MATADGAKRQNPRAAIEGLQTNIMSCFAVPFPVAPNEYDVFLVLDAKTVERMQGHDPFEIDLAGLGQPWAAMRLRRVHVTNENDEGGKRLMEMMRDNETKLSSIVKFLGRGYTFDPKLGDGQDPFPIPLGGKPS